MVGRKIKRKAGRHCGKGQGHKEREKVKDDSGLERRLLMKTRKIPGDPGI